MPSKEELVAGYLARLAEKPSFNETLQRTFRGGEEAAPSPERDRATSEAQAGMAEIDRGRVPTVEQTAGIEAIILPKIRPVLDVVDGKFRTEHPLWLKLNDDADVRGRLEAAIPLIGRIELPGHPDYPYGGTGFVVGPGLIMTNRHVAAIFTSGVGTLRLSIRTGLRAGIDFLRELDRPTGPTMMVKRVVMIHPYWDMALLAVEGLPDGKPLVLSQRDLSGDGMIEVAAIGYPAFDSRNDRDVQNDLFRKVFGVKRLQPGTLGGNQQTESFGKMVPAVRHNCTTLGGCSGAALVDLETGEVVALHFGGKYGVINFGVPIAELAKDSRVVDTGIQFAGKAPGGTPAWEPWWRRADEALLREAADPVRRGSNAQLRPDTRVVSPVRPAALQSSSDGTVEFTVPLHVTVRLGLPAKADEAVTTEAQVDAGAGAEAMVMPFHDEEYDSRTGYDANFLGIEVPMPQAADPSVVAKSKDGNSVLAYENFSIAMHEKRRLALLTASNVTAEPALKRPEPGRVYTRKALSGLGPNDQERWFHDPRLDDEFQLPDVFFTRDQGAFDKGHIVRREDVAFGTTYDRLRRANGDTYHVTNCSPQVAGFNQSSRGEDNWGDLENHVLSSASSERYCQFAGPILAADDEVFVGAGGGRVRLRVKIPSRFWKVIVALTDSGIAAYGFVLEQDLSDVPFEEFAVPENFQRFMESISDIEKRTGVRFPDVVRDADQHETNEGLDLAFRAGIRRRAVAGGVITEGVIV